MNRHKWTKTILIGLFCLMTLLPAGCGSDKPTEPEPETMRLTLPVTQDADVRIFDTDEEAIAENDGVSYNIGVVTSKSVVRVAYVALPVPDDPDFSIDRLQEATLILNCKSNAPVDLVVRPIMSDWDETTINGVTAPDRGAPIVELTRRSTSVRINVLSIYKDHNPTYGISIETAHEDGLWFYFRSSDNPVEERRPVVRLEVVEETAPT